MISQEDHQRFSAQGFHGTRYGVAQPQLLGLVHKKDPFGDLPDFFRLFREFLCAGIIGKISMKVELKKISLLAIYNKANLLQTGFQRLLRQDLDQRAGTTIGIDQRKKLLFDCTRQGIHPGPVPRNRNNRRQIFHRFHFS